MLRLSAGLLFTFCCSCFPQLSRAIDLSGPLDAEYCIVGGGPAGVQLGQFLLTAGRNYRIFETFHRAAAFFAADGKNMPVHRRLISINKRTIAQTDPEHRMRHDWNSLLGNEEVTPVTKRVKALYPQADVIADYCHDFSKPQIEAGKISFETSVTHITRCNPDKHEDGFCLKTSKGDAKCQTVIWAAGFGIPNTLTHLDPVTADMMEHYHHLAKKSAEDYEGKKVVVLGGGNAAFETVEWLQNHAQVTLVHRLRKLGWNTKMLALDDPLANGEPEAEGTKMAMMTHYVGDIRAHRLSVFDSYQMGGLDRPVRTPSGGSPWIIVKCQPDKLCMFLDGADKNGFINIGTSFSNVTKLEVDAAIKAYATEKGKDAANFKVEGCKLDKYNKKFHVARSYRLYIKLTALQEDHDTIPYLQRKTEKSNAITLDGENVLVVDSVVSCLGWRVNLNPFDLNTLPIKTVVNGKYPEIYDTYETKGVPGLFFAGTLAHSLDFKKSAGGFIHGFRYAVRTLFRYLEDERHNVPYPRKEFQITDSKHLLTEFADHIFYRWNNAAGPYQLFGGTLVDGVVFEPDCGEADTCPNLGVTGGKPSFKATYYDEMMPSYFFRKCQTAYCMIWFFEYGKGFTGPRVLDGDNIGSTDRMKGDQSTFLHPKVEFFAPDEKAGTEEWSFKTRAKPLLEHSGLESSTFFFSTYFEHVQPFQAYLKDVHTVLTRGIDALKKGSK